jgi:hypothetical protein
MRVTTVHLLTLQLVLGVFTGSLAWWLVLVALASGSRGRFGDNLPRLE